MSATQVAPTAPMTTRPDFADVYGQLLQPVWRFVRSRIGDPVEAQDVTSDVFVRAWRAWDRFDPARGPVEPWLFTIAARTVTDWWRRRRPEPVDHVVLVDRVEETALDPEEAVLRDELLRQLTDAMDRLDDREREGLALRFAGRLSSAHVARVLGVSPDAAKQLLHRAVRKLRAADVDDRVPAPSPTDLDAMIDGVLARDGAAAVDDELRSMLLHIEAAHAPETPPDLSDQVGDCISCEARGGAGGAAGAPRQRLRGAAVAGGATAGVLGFVPVCLACVLPAAHTLLAVVGLGAIGFYLHMSTPLVAVLVVWLLARGARRHGHRAGVRIAMAGAAFMALHLIRHDPVTDYLALTLLGLGALVNAAQVRRWRTEQRERFGLRRVDAGVAVR